MRPLPTFPAWRPRPFFHHEIFHRSKREGSRARVGRLHTPHGIVDTPAFVVVGTNAAVKFVDHRAADAAGMQLMFANTLHLMVHPGPEVVEKAGGLHGFINRPDRPIITDSGGFQIFSFANRGKLAMPGESGSSRPSGALPLPDVVSTGPPPRGEPVTARDESSLKSSRPVAARHRYTIWHSP